MSEFESSLQSNHDLQESSSDNSEIVESSQNMKNTNKINMITSESDEERNQFPKQKKTKIMRARILLPIQVQAMGTVMYVMRK